MQRGSLYIYAMWSQSFGEIGFTEEKLFRIAIGLLCLLPVAAMLSF